LFPIGNNKALWLDSYKFIHNQLLIIYLFTFYFKSIMNTNTQISTNNIRETLFGDKPLTSWGKTSSTGEPWFSFTKAKNLIESGNDLAAVGTLQEILQMSGLESRHYLQAHHFMRELGYQMDQEKELLGVVVEVALPEGLDLLAAYSDYTARYYNFSGSGVVWERPNRSLDEDITQVLQAGQVILDRIGPWDGARPDAPKTGNVRINLLTSAGLHFGEGPMNLLMNDQLGGTMLQAAIRLMERLIDITEIKK
jgi:hypothetical protein